jgi:hypothetical protein
VLASGSHLLRKQERDQQSEADHVTEIDNSPAEAKERRERVTKVVGCQSILGGTKRWRE